MSFDINSPFGQGSRYLRRAKQGPTAAALDLTVIPTFNSIGAPTAPTLATATTGGTLPAATYNYTVTALNANGETLQSPAASVAQVTTGTTSTVTVSWAAVTGAIGGYNIYGRTAGSKLLMGHVATGVLSFVDTGAVTPAGVPPTVDTTGTILGAVAGQVNAGDSLYRTASGFVASLNTPGAANANTATYIGESENTYPQVLGLGEGVTIGRPANDPANVRITIRQSGEFRKKTTPGETYAPGTVIYLGSDAQTVSSVAVGTTLGKVSIDQNPVLGGTGDGFSATITGAVGQDVVIEIAPPAAV